LSKYNVLAAIFFFLLLCRRIGALLLSSSIAAYAASKNKAEMARIVIDTSNFMAKPITDIKKLSENPHDMKTKMELLIMRIQVSFWNQTSSWYQILDVFTVETFLGGTSFLHAKFSFMNTIGLFHFSKTISHKECTQQEIEVLYFCVHD